MKRIKFSFFILLFGFVFLNHNTVQAQKGSKEIALFGKGCTMIYEVDFFGDTYLFIMRVIENSDNSIRFNYLITTDGKQGVVSINREALVSATKMFNYFMGGDIELTDQVSAWASRDVFKSLKSKGSAIVDPGEGSIPITYDKENGDIMYKVAIDDRYGEMNELQAIKAVNKDKGYTFIYYDDPKNPLGLEMKLNWSIRLIAVL